MAQFLKEIHKLCLEPFNVGTNHATAQETRSDGRYDSSKEDVNNIHIKTCCH